MLNGLYGRLLEGDVEKLIGIEEGKVPAFTARCRVCGYRSPLVEHEGDAQKMLSDHCNNDIHRARIVGAASQDYEETITARKTL